MSIDYFRQNIIEEEKEQECFIHTIYHDAQNGNDMRITMWDVYDVKEKKYVRKTSTYATNQYEKLACTGMNVNAYLALSTHAGTRRIHRQLFNRSVFYIDLDGHEFTSDDLEGAKEKTRKLLNHAWNTGKLPVPTMITSTGRGYGLFYVLERSIAATEGTKKLMKLFDRIYRGLIIRYQEILCELTKDITVSDGQLMNNLLSVDGCVIDSSRIARLPGTKNLNCGAMCRLVGYIPDGYYTIGDLKVYANVEKKTVKKEMEKRPACAYHVSAQTIKEEKLSEVARKAVLKERIKRMERFADLVKDEEEYREFACFQVYNAAIQIYDEMEPVHVLERFNQRLKKPLEDAELDSIVRNLDMHIEETGYAYRYSDERIVGSFKRKYEKELRQAGFGCGYKKVRDRAETHATNVLKRQTLWDEIIACAKANPDFTYAMIAEMYGRKENTIKKKLNAMGIYRYHVKEKVKEEVKEEKVDSVWDQGIDENGWEVMEYNPFTYAVYPSEKKVDYCVPCISYCVCDREDELRSKEAYQKLFCLHDLLTDDRLTFVNQMLVEIDHGKWDKDPEIDLLMNGVFAFDPYDDNEINKALASYRIIYKRIEEKLAVKAEERRRKKQEREQLRRAEREEAFQTQKERLQLLRETCKMDPKTYNPRIGKLFNHYYYVIYKDLKDKKGFQYDASRWISTSTIRRYLDGLTIDDMKEIVKESSEMRVIYKEYGFVLRMIVDVYEKNHKKEARSNENESLDE